MTRRTLLMVLAGIGAALAWAVLADRIIDRIETALYWREVRGRGDLADEIGRLGNVDLWSFERAAAAAGLARSETIKGAVDTVALAGDGRLRFAGWAVDTRQTRKPAWVFLVVPRVAVFVVQTGNARPDVADALLFPPGYMTPGFDAIFEHRIDCVAAKARPYAVAVTQDRQYAVIAPQVAIGGC